MKSVVLAAAALSSAVYGAKDEDLVKQLPGFPIAPFKVYSGYLTVPDYGGEYDELKIHYQFHEAIGNATAAPVTTWHQGGPGGNSLFGLFGELGYFQLEDDTDAPGTIRQRINENSWNKVSNMLYLESPAGSYDPIGFSSCKNKGKVTKCRWDDRSQAVAYAHTLKEFFKQFPEYANNDLYLSGESYAGQYIPNIAVYITRNKDVVSNLKGIAIGNGCWGGDNDHVQCNGPNSLRNDMDMYYGKGLMSKETYTQIQNHCHWDWDEKPSSQYSCNKAITKAYAQVGPHNVYNIYDTCPLSSDLDWHKASGKDVQWVTQYQKDALDKGISNREQREYLTSLGGGVEYGCNQQADLGRYFHRSDVQKAMNLNEPIPHGAMQYTQSGPASMLLYPAIIHEMRVLLYSGDADACVPYKGTEEMTDSLAEGGHIRRRVNWKPWYQMDTHRHHYAPAGYATTYLGPTDFDFLFVTIRLAGHMVPSFQSENAFSMFKKWINKEPF